MLEHGNPDHDCEMCREIGRLTTLHVRLLQDFDSDDTSAFEARAIAVVIWEIEAQIHTLSAATKICSKC